MNAGWSFISKHTITRYVKDIERHDKVRNIGPSGYGKQRFMFLFLLANACIEKMES